MKLIGLKDNILVDLSHPNAEIMVEAEVPRYAENRFGIEMVPVYFRIKTGLFYKLSKRGKIRATKIDPQEADLVMGGMVHCFPDLKALGRFKDVKPNPDWEDQLIEPHI